MRITNYLPFKSVKTRILFMVAYAAVYFLIVFVNWVFSALSLHPSLGIIYGFAMLSVFAYLMLIWVRADQAKPAPIRFYRVADDPPIMGQRVILYTNGVIQNETYEYDMGDECGAFWSRDDLDECPLVNNNDLFLPIDQLMDSVLVDKNRSTRG